MNRKTPRWAVVLRHTANLMLFAVAAASILLATNSAWTAYWVFPPR